MDPRGSQIQLTTSPSSSDSPLIISPPLGSSGQVESAKIAGTNLFTRFPPHLTHHANAPHLLDEGLMGKIAALLSDGLRRILMRIDVIWNMLTICASNNGAEMVKNYASCASGA